MIRIHQLTYNPFAENTYLLEDEKGNVLIFDPGMYNAHEQVHFAEYLKKNELKPLRVILTHAHLDHVFGLAWIYKTYQLKPSMHKDDFFIYENARNSAMMYGLEIDELPPVESWLSHGDTVDFDGDKLKVVHSPGHSPGSLSFICDSQKFVLSGDVLFQGSIGRSDLPGGDFDILLKTIHENFLSLGDDYIVYSGHGPETSIGRERNSNPFL